MPHQLAQQRQRTVSAAHDAGAAHLLLRQPRIERATNREIAVRYLCADTHPDHDTIASFRRDNGPLLAACFTRVLGLAKEMKLAKLGEMALDGSKIRDSAAKRSTLRWEQVQQQVLELETQVEALLTQAAQTDAHEKNAADGQRLPKELRDKQKRLEAMRRAMASVEQRTAQRAKQREQSCGVEIYCPPEEGGGRAPSEVKHRQTRRRQCTQEHRQRMRERMDSEEGRESQKVRTTTVEPVFG